MSEARHFDATSGAPLTPFGEALELLSQASSRFALYDPNAAVLEKIEALLDRFPAGSETALYNNEQPMNAPPARTASETREKIIEECFTHLAKVEFFHDGLSADLQEVKDKAHAYKLGWQDAMDELLTLKNAAPQESQPKVSDELGKFDAMPRRASGSEPAVAASSTASAAAEKRDHISYEETLAREVLGMGAAGCELPAAATLLAQAVVDDNAKHPVRMTQDAYEEFLGYRVECLLRKPSTPSSERFTREEIEADKDHSMQLACGNCHKAVNYIYCPYCGHEQDTEPKLAASANALICPKCGTDRGKAPCPKGHAAATMGQCPMVGTAEGPK